MLPEETKLALFPSPLKVCRMGVFGGWLVLPPPSLAHVAAMESLGCEPMDMLPSPGNAVLAAWLLTLGRDRLSSAANGDIRGATEFARRVGPRRITRVVNAARRMIGDAVLPFVPPKQDEGVFRVDDGIGHGYGWPLEVAEALCAHYGWDFDTAVWTPAQRAFALLAVGRGREGVDAGGPDYYDRIRLEKWRQIGIIGGKKEAGNG